MGEKTEQWAWTRIRELEIRLARARRETWIQRRRAESWKRRALKKAVKR